MELPPLPGPPPLLAADYLGPVCAAALFVVLMQFVREPSRRIFNAVLVAGTAGTYLSGGFGGWELVYPTLVTPVLYCAVTSSRFIGLAWLMHAGWDLAHHFWGRPIWPFMPASSFGCFLFDTLIALWFLAGAPTLFATHVGLRAKG
jgi:hypothetical protein